MRTADATPLNDTRIELAVIEEELSSFLSQNRLSYHLSQHRRIKVVDDLFLDRFHFTSLHSSELQIVLVDEDSKGLSQPANSIVKVEAHHLHREVDRTSVVIADIAAVLVLADTIVERWLTVRVERTETPMLLDREPKGISNLLYRQVNDFLDVGT